MATRNAGGGTEPMTRPAAVHPNASSHTRPDVPPMLLGKLAVQRRDLPALRTQPKYQRATCARARHATWCMCSPVVPAAGVASIPDDHPGATHSERRGSTVRNGCRPG